MHLKLITIIVVFISFINAQDRTPCQDKPQGWYIIVCVEHIETDFRIEIGHGDEDLKNTHQPWREWRKGEPAVFSVPTQFLYVNQIWIKTTPFNEDNNVYIWIMYNGVCRDHINKDDSHEVNPTVTDVDDWTCD